MRSNHTETLLAPAMVVSVSALCGLRVRACVNGFYYLTNAEAPPIFANDPSIPLIQAPLGLARAIISRSRPLETKSITPDHRPPLIYAVSPHVPSTDTKRRCWPPSRGTPPSHGLKPLGDGCSPLPSGKQFQCFFNLKPDIHPKASRGRSRSVRTSNRCC